MVCPNQRWKGEGYSVGEGMKGGKRLSMCTFCHDGVLLEQHVLGRKLLAHLSLHGCQYACGGSSGSGDFGGGGGGGSDSWCVM